jgi:hypothetical protein
MERESLALLTQHCFTLGFQFTPSTRIQARSLSGAPGLTCSPSRRWFWLDPSDFTTRAVFWTPMNARACVPPTLLWPMTPHSCATRFAATCAVDVYCAPYFSGDDSTVALYKDSERTRVSVAIRISRCGTRCGESTSVTCDNQGDALRLAHAARNLRILDFCS